MSIIGPQIPDNNSVIAYWGPHCCSLAYLECVIVWSRYNSVSAELETGDHVIVVTFENSRRSNWNNSPVHLDVVLTHVAGLKNKHSILSKLKYSGDLITPTIQMPDKYIRKQNGILLSDFQMVGFQYSNGNQIPDYLATKHFSTSIQIPTVQWFKWLKVAW